MTANPLFPLLISLLFGALSFGLKLLHAGLNLRPRSIKALSYGMILAWICFSGYALVSLAMALYSSGPLVVSPGAWPAPLGLSFVFDHLALGGNLLLVMVGGVSLLFAAGDGEYPPSFFFFTAFLLAACQGVLSSRDLFTLFVCFEILAIAAYILIAYKKKPRALFSAFRYLLLATLSISLYLTAVFIIYRKTGTLSIPLVAVRFHLLSPGEQSFAAAALLCGILTRMAVLPFHGWLPEAHSMAVHPVSAMLSGFVIKVPIVVLLRVFPIFGSQLGCTAGGILLGLGLLSAAGGVVMALSQRDAKRLLAYHSVSQIGYITSALGVSFITGGKTAKLALFAALFHAFNHGLFKSLLFLSTGSSCDRVGGRDVYRLRSLASTAGLWFPLFLIGAGGIAGLPLLNGYLSKNLISSLFYEHKSIYYLLSLVSAATAASFIKLGRIYLPERGIPSAAPLARKGSSPVSLIAAGVLALGIILIGSAAPLSYPFLPASVVKGLTKSWLPASLIKQALLFAAGLCIYLLFRSKAGKRFSATMRRREPGSEVLLQGMMIGFILILLLIFSPMLDLPLRLC